MDPLDYSVDVLNVNEVVVAVFLKMVSVLEEIVIVVGALDDGLDQKVAISSVVLDVSDLRSLVSVAVVKSTCIFDRVPFLVLTVPKVNLVGFVAVSSSVPVSTMGVAIAYRCKLYVVSSSQTSSVAVPKQKATNDNVDVVIAVPSEVVEDFLGSIN